jgi:hypothetical protein
MGSPFVRSPPTLTRPNGYGNALKLAVEIVIIAVFMTAR